MSTLPRPSAAQTPPTPTSSPASASTPPDPAGPRPSAATAIRRAIEPHPDAVSEATVLGLASATMGLDALATDRACAQTLAGVALLLGMSRDDFTSLCGRWYDHAHRQVEEAGGQLGTGEPIVGALTRDPAPPTRGS